MDFHDHLMFPNLNVKDRDELLEVIGGAVISAGFAKANYVTALKDRESNFPTGLPISGGVLPSRCPAGKGKGVVTGVSPCQNAFLPGSPDWTRTSNPLTARPRPSRARCQP